ncbi:MAG: class I SAM-dependent methyltransferase [Propionibacteriaceae bacterium]
MPKPSLNDFLSKASFWPVQELCLTAWTEHAPFAFWIMDALRPSSVVELGTHNGYSFFAFCQAAKALGLDTQLYAVDTWQGDVHSGVYDNSVYESVQAVVARDYADRAHLVRATFNEARSQFPDGSVDLVHVDGRHFYDDVKEDVETYLSALSDRGVMILHDIVVHERDFGVHQYWEELQERYSTFGFTHCNGLGVVAVGPNVPPKVRALVGLQADGELAGLVRAAYARLGAAVPTPWAMEGPSVAAVQQRLTEVERELTAVREEARRATAELHFVRERLSAARVTLSRLGVVARVVDAIPSGFTHGAYGRVRDAAARVRRRVEPTSSPVQAIFDDAWYSRTYGITGDRKDLLLDYVKTGAFAGRSPSPLFDPEWYAASNPDLAGLNRLQQAEHFVTVGGLEGRSPHPFFDSTYYLSHNPDVSAAGINPLAHYQKTGDREGRRPNPYFDPAWYRKVHGLVGPAATAYLESPLPRPAPSEDFDLSTPEDAGHDDVDPLIVLLMKERRPA